MRFFGFYAFVSEQKSCPEVTKKNGIHKKKLLIVNPDITHKTKGNIKSIILRRVEISSSKPNNIVKLNSGKVFSIVRIKKKQQNFFFMGSCTQVSLMFSNIHAIQQKLEL